MLNTDLPGAISLAAQGLTDQTFHIITALRGRQEFVGCVVSPRLGSEWGGSCDCSFLEGGVGVLVEVRCLGRLVAEPQRDRRDVDIVGAQEHGVGMAQGVRCDAFRWQRRTGDGSSGDRTATTCPKSPRANSLAPIQGASMDRRIMWNI